MVHDLGFKFYTLWFFAKDLQTLLSLRLKFYILLCSAHSAHWKFLWILLNFVKVRAHLKPEWNSKKLTVWTVYNKASLMLERGNLYFQRICNFCLHTESYQKLLFVQTLYAWKICTSCRDIHTECSKHFRWTFYSWIWW